MTTTVDLSDLDVPFDAAALTGRQHLKRDQALDRIRRGCSDHEIHRRLQMGRGAIRRIRRQLALPPGPLQPLTWNRSGNCEPKNCPTGMGWTGLAAPRLATPVLHYRASPKAEWDREAVA